MSMHVYLLDFLDAVQKGNPSVKTVEKIDYRRDSETTKLLVVTLYGEALLNLHSM